MRIAKHVRFNRTGKTIVIYEIPRHRRAMYAPRAKVNLQDLGMKKQEWGY